MLRFAAAVFCFNLEMNFHISSMRLEQKIVRSAAVTIGLTNRQHKIQYKDVGENGTQVSCTLCYHGDAK